jgi:integrase
MATKLISFITLEEAKKLIAKAPSRQLKVAIALGFGSGLRISEIVGAKRRDGTIIPPLAPEMVDLKTRQIRISQAKGKKDRVTVTNPWLNETNIQVLPIKMPVRTLQNQFNSLTKKVLGRRCNFHMLRHGFGNYMVVEKNVPITVVQTLMGHARTDTTGVYAKANPKQAIDSAWEAFQ